MNKRLVKYNLRIHEAMEMYSLYQYQLADILGINEGTLCRLLRKELPEEKQSEILAAIERHFRK